MCNEHGSAYIFSWSLFPLFGYISRSGIAELYGNSNFAFWETSVGLSIEAAPIYIPSNSPQCSLFSTFLPTLRPFLFGDRHSNGCEVISHCGFNLHFPDDYWYWPCFHLLVNYLVVFFRKISIQFFFPFLNHIILFYFIFWDWVVWILSIFWYNPLSNTWFGIFFSFSRMPFHFIYYFFCCQSFIIWCSST